MDFFQIAVKELKSGGLEARPDFIVGRSKDLMVRAKNFYAVWDEEAGLWSTDEYDVQRLVDAELEAFKEKHPDVRKLHRMRSFSSNVQSQFRKYLSQISDNSHQLDNKVVFSDTPVKKNDYASKRLPYAMSPGECNAWDTMMTRLYAPEERAKIEWAFGAIIAGESKKIQKFLVLYGKPGAGKGTVIDVALMLFEGYTTTFIAKELGSSNNRFAVAAFAGNPLVGVQHDGDLSKIEDNTVLNSVVSHEVMKVDEKFKPQYDAKINAFLIMGTNKPVQITDAQSGLIRRLIDVHPTGNTFTKDEYDKLRERLPFELGAIAHHCLQVFKSMGKNYYGDYRPMEMMYKTNSFFNFIELYYDMFEKQDGVSAKQAWTLYKEYCDEAKIKNPLQMYAFRSELGHYFERFHDRLTLDGAVVRSYYSGFKTEPFKAQTTTPTTPTTEHKASTFTLRMEETISLLDVELAECIAQYAKSDGSPTKYWDDSERIIGGELKRPQPNQIVNTRLRDLDSHREHYVQPPVNLIVADFDLTDENGEKSLEKNLEAASEWPPTYAELSKSGKGVHLHYYYHGDVTQLEKLYAPGIEIKVFTGNAALRRRLSQCNNVPVATISSGLPLKEKTRVLEPGTMKSEKALRDLIARNLNKEIHPGTKPSIDFIKKILDDAYEDGLSYDVSDLYPKIVGFANKSTNRPLDCLRIVNTMRFKSDEDIPEETPSAPKDDRLVFFDIESYPNLFVICWKFEEEAGKKPSIDNVVRMINPAPHEVEALLGLKLVGFNNRNYDNHMLWGAIMGFSVLQLYHLSQKIIAGSIGAKFGEAYRVSYTDVYDYSTKKQGLKKWQIERGLVHREMDIPWDKPVPENRIIDVVDYCANDVVSLEEVHGFLQGDWKARLILSDLSGLTPNDTTAKQTAAIVFGKGYEKRNIQREFVYTDLSKDFPGYVFKEGKSTYRGETVGEGGYVYAEPGLYRDVVLLDVASMHPTSIGQLNLFGDEYTPRFMALVEAQLVIKHFYPDDAAPDWVPDFDSARNLLGGKLTPYIDEIQLLDRDNRPAAKKAAKALRYGLKIAINIVYGLTSAKFDNPFRDLRNADNIVAKRGALFMIDLKHFIQEELGLQVVHIKTDSVKVTVKASERDWRRVDDADIISIQDYAKKYGYDMEREARYEKFGLVNDAVYVAKKSDCIDYCWSATGKEFQVPYIFKKMFSGDDIVFDDLCETKHVQQGSLHLDFGMPEDISYEEFEYEGAENGWVNWALAAIKKMKKNGAGEEEQQRFYADCLDKLIFVGKTGRFTPVKEGWGGGHLYRIKDGKHYAVQGTKGHLWADSDIAAKLPGDAIDYEYFEHQLEEARKSLENFLPGSEFSSVDEFIA